MSLEIFVNKVMDNQRNAALVAQNVKHFGSIEAFLNNRAFKNYLFKFVNEKIQDPAEQQQIWKEMYGEVVNGPGQATAVFCALIAQRLASSYSLARVAESPSEGLRLLPLPNLNFLSELISMTALKQVITLPPNFGLKVFREIKDPVVSAVLVTDNSLRALMIGPHVPTLDFRHLPQRRLLMIEEAPSQPAQQTTEPADRALSI